MSNSINQIRARAIEYAGRHPSPVVMAKVANQMHADIVALLAECERLKAAP